VGFLGVTSALFLSRRTAQLGPADGSTEEQETTVADLILAGRGFDYEVTEGEERLFHIRADRVVTDRESLIGLEQVRIDVTHNLERQYRVEAARGTYQAEERRAELEGGAVVTDDRGLELRSEGFELGRKGRVVTSSGPVTYRLSERLEGRADSLVAYLNRDRFQLTGNVQMRGRSENPSFSLRCRRMVYEEETGIIHAEGRVVLRQGEDELRAQRLSVTLGEDGNALRFVRARRNVNGVQQMEDDEGLGKRMRFAAEELALEYDQVTGEPARAELDALSGRRVFFEIYDDTGRARRLTAPYIVVAFQNGSPWQAEAFEPVDLREYFTFSPDTQLLRACARSATAGFASSGELANLVLEGGVDLHQSESHTVGERLAFEQEKDSIVVTGSPAEMHTSRGRLDAPEILYVLAEESITARGGVRAEFQSGEGFSMIGATPESEERTPLRVTAEEAGWRSSPERYHFQGTVRAWQDEDFLLADELVGDQDGDRLVASGAVKTVIKGRRTDEEDATTEERSPFEVTADELTYQRSERLVRYQGSPRVQQAGRTLRCDDLTLYMTDESELERMLCIGNAIIEDRAAGRRVEGSRADYVLASSRVEVLGAPAILKDPAGSEVRGARVIYDLESGTAQVQSAGSGDRAEAEQGT
jgi:lipopolysaccharide transport protein LptA